MSIAPSSPATPPETDPTSSMEEQLCALYAERETLERELGVSDADQIVALVRRLEARLAAFEQQAAKGGRHE